MTLIKPPTIKDASVVDVGEYKKLFNEPVPSTVSVRQAISTLSRKLGLTANPVFTGLTLTGLTASRLVWTDSNKALESKDLVDLVVGTANRVTVTDDSTGGIVLTTPQDTHTGATNFTVAGGSFTDVFSGVLPIIGDHLATKEYVDLAIGTEIDFFLSNTASGIGSNYLMYPHDTEEAESTLNSAALNTGDDQLIFSFLTEAGQPALLYLRDGIYDLHAHFNNAVGNKPTILYWTLSYVDADGSSNETLIITGESSTELTSSEASYDLHAVAVAETVIDVTKRLLVKVYANVTSGGSNSVITITMEGTTDSHITVEAPSDIWQRQGDVLDDLNTLGQVAADSEFLVGTGVGVLAWESGATVRTSLELGTGNTPQFTGIELGHASDTTITRASAGNLNIEGNLIYRAGGTDVPIADGGTGQSTAQLAINALSAVSGATNEYVLTKDTATGNALWKTSTAGTTWISLTDTDPANYTGEAGNAVVVNAGEDGLEFGAAPGGGGFSSRCSVYLSANQSIPDNAFTKIQFNTEVFDSDSEFDNVTNYRFTATNAGYYQVSTCVNFEAIAASVQSQIGLLINGATYEIAPIFAMSSSGSFSIEGSKTVYLLLLIILKYKRIKIVG